MITVILEFSCTDQHVREEIDAAIIWEKRVNAVADALFVIDAMIYLYQQLVDRKEKHSYDVIN